MAQVGDTLKANSTSSEALAQRVDALNKDIDDVKRKFEEVRQNDSTVSPGVALIAALAALVLGPFVAYKFTENQLSAVRQQSNPDAAQSQAAKTEESRRYLLPHFASRPPAWGLRATAGRLRPK